MSSFRTLLIKSQNAFYDCHKQLSLPSIIHRTLASSFSSASSAQTQNETQTNQLKKPLRLFFQEAVGLCNKTDTNTQSKSESTESNEVMKKLWELEREVRDLRKAAESMKHEVNKKLKKNVQQKKSEKPTSLFTLFTGKSGEKVVKMRRNEEDEGGKVFKELSPEMKTFVSHLYKEGYFNEASFSRRGKLDFSDFDDSYGRDFIKFAAEKFGQDHQNIAKWLSGSDLKKVALFGCPSLMRKNVFSAKSLRKFFEIQEDTVCSKCVLKHSCKFVNQGVRKGDTSSLNLAVVMRVITIYALEAVHPDLSVPDEIKASVSRLLQEVVNLSQTAS